MIFNKKTLPNGLRVVTIPLMDNPSVTVLVMVEAGSKYETKKLSGMSHFLEHMTFKGTPRRPKAVDISRELDAIGASYNAFTGHEFTGYYAKAEKSCFDTILDVVSDIYLNPLFDPKEMEKEKGVIVEEIRMYNDLPQAVAQYAFMDVVYGDQPAGRQISGTEENVRAFTRDELVTYRGDHYVASATTVFVAGAIDETEALKKVGLAFAPVSAGNKKGKEPVTDTQDESRIKAIYKETDQTHLVLGFRSFGAIDPRMPAMQVLSTVLGRGMSSRLFSRMREDLGICYYIKADNDSFTDHGVFAISAGVDNSRVDVAIKEILAQCALLKDTLVPPEELAKAKDHIAGSTMLELETSEARAEFCGSQEMVKHEIESPEALMAKVREVTAEDVRSLSRDIFVNEGLNMAIVGRFKDDAAFRPYFVV